MDEVDAPLDDVNIHKFTRVLSKFCDETQFIIVTHNKLTMEIADYMYGVTQEKKGRSIICAAVAYDELHDLAGFLLRECCADARPGITPEDHDHG